MSKVDWSKAPEGTDFYANGMFWRRNGMHPESYGWSVSGRLMHEVSEADDYQVKPPPQQWPSDDRIDIVGTNGNDGLHYNAQELTTIDEKQKEVSMSHYDEQREQEEAKRIMESRKKQEAYRTAPSNKYERLIIGKRNSGNCVIDVYRVIDAYGVQCPAVAHALKKLLCTGTRGYKDYPQDLVEAIKSIEEALELFVDKNSSDQSK